MRRSLSFLSTVLALLTFSLSIAAGAESKHPGEWDKPVPAPSEGLPASNGFDVLGVVKNPPNPNAVKVFIKWFLSREGQDWYGKIIENGTRGSM